MTLEELEELTKEINEKNNCLQISEEVHADYERQRTYITFELIGLTVRMEMETDYFNIETTPIGFILDDDLKRFLKACVEFSQTPIKDRFKEKHYYLKHKYLGRRWERYLCKNEGMFDIVSMGMLEPHHKIDFTKKEIEEIEEIEKSGFDLRNFERIEVGE